MNKAPKKYECLECGFKSSRSKTLTIGQFGFARCFKCRGRVKEREEWLEWYNNEMAEWRKSVEERRISNLPKAIVPTDRLTSVEAEPEGGNPC